jgi:SsrA-binding protein
MATPTSRTHTDRVVASNRRARHDYAVLDTVECGIVLFGSEVKALRDAKVQLADAYARVERGELWLHGMHVSPYSFATGFGAHSPDRPRKLLVHKAELERLASRVAQEKLTLVPLSVYFKQGRAKVELALARGRKTEDRRQAIAERDAKRETERELGRRLKGRV